MLQTFEPLGFLDSEDFLRTLLVPRFHDSTKLPSPQLVDLDEHLLESPSLLLTERDGSPRTEEATLKRERIPRGRLCEERGRNLLRRRVRCSAVSVSSLMP